MRRALAVLLAAGVVLLSATPAAAHNYLVASSPEEGSTIDVLPEAFSITTNDQLLDLTGEADGFALEVTDAAGAYYGDGCLTVDGATLSAGAALGEPGDYRLVYRFVSADGHTVIGELAFTWAGEPTAQGTSTPPDCGGTVDPAPAATAAPQQRQDAALGDVLWIGGAIAAVLIAGLITVMLLTRRKPQE
ncbi:MAG TPA: copper resistance protein CopC [Rhodoglobus sp.]|nr:copper resistance protein CopC [Rhodoglobus sp.]